MTRKLERDFLQSELAAVDDLLRSTPPEDTLGRIGFEARRGEIVRSLENIHATPTPRAATLLEFGGRPVLGSRGIESDFAGKALDKYQDIVAKVLAARQGELGGRGVVRGR